MSQGLQNEEGKVEQKVMPGLFCRKGATIGSGIGSGVVLSVLIFPSPIWMGLPWKNCEQFSDQAKSYIVDQKDYKWNYCIWIGKDSMAEFFVMSLLCFKYITQFHHYFCMLFEIFYNNHLVVPYSIDMTLSLNQSRLYPCPHPHTVSRKKEKYW